ncbi:MAG: ABC transporter permease [Pikeienuella sp.]
MNEFLAEMRMEWRSQWARPFVWFCLLGSFALAGAATLENAYGVRGFAWVNGGDAIATRALMLSVLGIIIVAGVVGEAMSRDRAAGTEETIMMTGAGRVSSGLGRFLVAFAIVMIAGAMFIPGMILGAMAPGVPEERIGPFVGGHYLKAVLIYVAPNFLLVSALIYAVAARWRSQTAAFVTALGLIALYATALMLLGQDAYRHDVFGIFALIDPYGNIAGAEYAMTWTVAENNTGFRPLAGLLLVNRLIWCAVALGLIALGTIGAPRFLSQPRQKAPSKRAGARALPAAYDNQLLRLTLWEVTTLRRQPGVLLLMGFAAFSLWWAAASAVTYSYSLPTTDLLIHNSGYYFDKVLVVLLVWYAADIIWRERQFRVDELIDATPGGDAARFLAKTLALLLVVLLFWTLSILVNLTYQIASGFHDFEWGLYLFDTFLVKAPYYLWMAVLAMAMQVIIRQRYIAMVLALFVYLSGPLFDALGLYHPLYRFGDTGFFWYSPIDGYGHFLKGHFQLAAWWTLASLLIWLIAWGAYARGTEPPPRRALWKARLTRGRGGALFAATLAALVIMGGAIFYQTTILHRWPLFNEGRYMAWIETTYRAEWADRPQPKITAISGDIELYPERRAVEMQGAVTVENQSDAAIEELIVFFHPLLKEATLDLAGVAELDEARSDPHVQIWRLASPLAPGASLDLPFRTAGRPDPGFAAHNPNDTIPEVQGVEVIGNGTSIMNLNLIPALGYSERLEHKPAWLRREYGLASEWSPPASTLGDRVAHDTTHLAWVRSIDVTVGTSADQIPLYSGTMAEDYGVKDGRRRIRYVSDFPSRGWAEVMSARYDVYRRERPGLPPVELYHHPAHDYTLEPNAEALLDAMAYFRSRYGPPPFTAFRVGEASLHYTGFGARGGLGFVTEVMGWKTDLARSKGEDLRKNAANLMGVSWWLDQVMAANLPGAKSVLSGIPYWTSALYMHRSRGPALSREMRLQDMMETYRHRAQLEDEERPFIEEMKDSTMIRNKGALHIVYLAELVGQERLEAAFAKFLDEWRFRPAPYPSAADLLARLKAELPAEAGAPLDDFFLNVANWRLNVRKAKTWRDDAGRWRLGAVVEAAKTYSEGLGIEAAAPLDTPIPIAVFRGAGFAPGDVIAEEWLTLKSGRNEIELTLEEKPARFGIDPYLLLPDSNPYDNVVEVSER